MGFFGLMHKACSREHVLYLLYLTLFLIPLNPFLFYAPLIPALILWLVNWRTSKEVSFRVPPYWGAGAVFLACSLLSTAVSKDSFFSIFNWSLQPLLYAAVYLMVFSTIRTVREKEKALYAFLAGALCVAAYGFFQYADAHDMAKDLTAQSWVDPERFPLLRRRMYSTLENPNLLGAYLLMIISALSSFFLLSLIHI